MRVKRKRPRVLRPLLRTCAGLRATPFEPRAHHGPPTGRPLPGHAGPTSLGPAGPALLRWVRPPAGRLWSPVRRIGDSASLICSSCLSRSVVMGRGAAAGRSNGRRPPNRPQRCRLRLQRLHGVSGRGHWVLIACGAGRVGPRMKVLRPGSTPRFGCCCGSGRRSPARELSRSRAGCAWCVRGCPLPAPHTPLRRFRLFSPGFCGARHPPWSRRTRPTFGRSPALGRGKAPHLQWRGAS